MFRTRFALALLFAVAAFVPSTFSSAALAQSSGTTYYVAQTVTASDANPGTALLPLRTIGAAVGRAAAGDTINVGDGTYAEAVTIAGNSGSASKPITLRATGAATIKPSSGKPLVIARSYWVVEGFAIDAGARSSPAVSFQAPATFSTLRNAHLFNGSYHGVVFDDGSSDNQVLSSEIDHFGLASSSSDAHGVAIHESHNNLIQGNHIHHNTGDSVQVFTIDTQTLYPKTANNNRIVGNTMHDDRENAVDIKSSRGTVVSGNVMYGYRPSATSDGMAIVVHYNTQDALIANNAIYDSNWGIEVSRGTKNGTAYPAAPLNVTIRNNYIHDLVKLGTGNSGDGAGIVVREAANVLVWNNTVRNAAGICLVATWSGTAAPTGLQLKNNSTGGCGDADLFLKETTTTGLQVDYNHYDQLGGGRLKRGSTTYTLANWVSRFGLDQHSIIAAPTLLASGSPPAGSPLIDRGTNVGLPFCGAAPDLGAFETGCGGATATATNTPAATATATNTSAATATRTGTPTRTGTATRTATRTGTPTRTGTATRTPTRTSTAAATASATSTPMATATATSTPMATATATSTPMATATATSTPMATATITPTPMATSTRTPTPMATATATSTPVATTTSTPSPTPTSGGGGATRYYALDGGQGGFVEAELSSSQAGNFVAVGEAGRGNGQYIHTPDGSGTDRLTSYVAYEIEVTNGGTFYLWLLSTGPDSGSDSFWVALDAGGDTQVSTGTNGAWEWKKMSGTLNLANGRHTLFIRVREDGARVDQLYLSKSSTAPSGVGSPTLPPQYR